MKIKEIYESFFSYTVDDLLEYAKKKKPINISLSELMHQYDLNKKVSKTRMSKIVIDGYPIIITKRDGSWVTLDGFHRALKAIGEGRTHIKAVVITKSDMIKLKKMSS